MIKQTTSVSDHPPRIAASSYLNTAPLIWSFIHGLKRATVRLSTNEAPARCADLLASGEVDAALVPVIEYHRIPGIAVVPDVCVGSRSAVLSVVIASKSDDLRSLRQVVLDESSRTSVALLKIIFREFLGTEPEWRTSSPDLPKMLVDNDAALVIGDPAMRIPRDELHVFDLAALWRQYTGLGFVFAMWMARTSEAGRVRAVDFAGARDEGLAHLDEIVSAHETMVPMSPGEIRDYLTKNIAFQMDDDMKRGLQLYFELAEKHDLIAKLKPLEFIS